jgi:hypothetical protein
MTYLKNIDDLKPKGPFGIKKYPLVHIGNLSNPYFVTIGCSYTTGYGLDYKNTWSKKLGDYCNLEHINLGFSGSSLEYQYDKIKKLENILTDAKFVIWMQTYPHRSHRIYNFLIGDRYARIKYKKTNNDVSNWYKIEKYIDLVKNKKILITNCWGYDLNLRTLLKAKFAKRNKKFYFNDTKWIDYADDNQHPGVITNKVFAKNLYLYLKNNFINWLT